MVKNNAKSMVMLIASMCIYGSVGIFRRYIPVSSTVLALARGMIGTVFILCFMLLKRKKIKSIKTSKKLLFLIISGSLMGLNWMFLFEAYNYTSVATATLCYYMQPIIVILLSPIVCGERLTKRQVTSVTMAVVGMVFVSGVVDTEIEQAGELIGILLGLGGAILYAAVVLINKQITKVNTYEKTLIQLASATVTLIPYLLLTEDFSKLSIKGNTWILLIIVGVVHTGLAYCLYFGSIEGLKAQTVALFSYIDPVVAILLSAIILNEKMTVLGIMGAVLVLGSTIFNELSNGNTTNQGSV